MSSSSLGLVGLLQLLSQRSQWFEKPLPFELQPSSPREEEALADSPAWIYYLRLETGQCRSKWE